MDSSYQDRDLSKGLLVFIKSGLIEEGPGTYEYHSQETKMDRDGY